MRRIVTSGLLVGFALTAMLFPTPAPAPEAIEGFGEGFGKALDAFGRDLSEKPPNKWTREDLKELKKKFRASPELVPNPLELEPDSNPNPLDFITPDLGQIKVPLEAEPWAIDGTSPKPARTQQDFSIKPDPNIPRSAARSSLEEVRHSPEHYATELQIRLDRFSRDELGSIDYSALKIGDAYYHVDLQAMFARQQAVAQAEPADGFIIERLGRASSFIEEPLGQADEVGRSSAFVLYTRTGPQFFDGVETLFDGVDALEQQTKSAQEAGSKLNLTITGAGSAKDLDAVQLSIAVRAGSDITFRTPETYRSVEPSDARLMLDPKGFLVELRGQLWVAVQRIGDVIVTVSGATRDQALERMAAIRMSLVAGLTSNPKYNDHLLRSEDNQLKFNDAVFANDSSELNFAIITENIAAGRILLPDNPSHLPLDPPFDFQIQIQNETRSQRFAVLPPVSNQQTAVLREDDAAR
ncbi:MAG: hypothetical protein ACLQBA_01760 [Candidatus Binataceae bacterium]